MQGMPFTEKRVFPRFTTSIPLTFLDPTSQKSFNALTHDISSQGLCIVADQEFASGLDLDMRIQMTDNNEKICLKGKVIWSSLINAGKYKIGIKLVEPTLKPIPLVLRIIMAQRKR